MELFQGEMILINKPYHWTSFDVVKKLSKPVLAHYLRQGYVAPEVKRIKIGHAGTLDPLATGLLVICTGKQTKRISEIQEAEKEYEGTFVLGFTTESFDLEKEVLPRENVILPTEKKIHEAAAGFKGKQLQTPPLHSAVKLKGTRAYNLARSGRTANLTPKEIMIRVFDIVAIRGNEVDFRIVCSKGTYIRSLARDLGEKLETGAYLSRLCRTRIGDLFLDNSLTPEEYLRQLSDKQVAE